MSKKSEAIKKAVFYAHEKPDLLADILVGLVSDVATTVTLKGDTSIKKPSTGNVTADYEADVLSQYGDVMSGTVTLALKEAVTGVSVSGKTVTVASTVTATSFILKATSGSLTKELIVSIV